MDQRLDGLTRWAIGEIDSQTGLKLDGEAETVSGDASFRRYFRLRADQRSWILVDAPPEKENSDCFVKIAREWIQGGVRVPQVLSVDLEQGYMLLEDFGDQLMWPALVGQSDEPRLRLYGQAIDQLIRLQSLPFAGLPAYDKSLLDREMALFPDWLCEQHLGLALSDSERSMLDGVFELLATRALKQPQVVVHRDFHSRNLMLLADGDLGIIDFQDAVVGPLTYDLVSLLRDCYVRWDDALVATLAKDFWSKSVATGVYSGEWSEFEVDFDWMGMQRHLKAAGIFARLNIRDGKTGYLKDIPNTCQYLLDVAQRYPEFAEFSDWMANRFLPALEPVAA